jgi:transcriptional regulator with XRE-family HTH domain
MSKKASSKAKKSSRRGKKRPFRGETLVRAVKAELGRRVNLSPTDAPINVTRIAKALGISRQAIYDNELDEAIEDYDKLQRTNFDLNIEAAVLRRPLEERIGTLEAEKKELLEKLDGWVERWAAVEYNAKLHGYDADKLFAPLPPPLRKTLTFKKKKK